jgi:hypothetical protein
LGALCAGSAELLTAESAGSGFISLQASRYCSNEERLDPGQMQIDFRAAILAAGKTYQIFSAKMYATRKSISFAE